MSCMTCLLDNPAALPAIKRTSAQQTSLRAMNRFGERAECWGRLARLTRSAKRKAFLAREAERAWAEYQRIWKELRELCVAPQKLRLYKKDGQPILVDKAKTPVFFDPPTFNLTDPNPLTWGGIRLGLNTDLIPIHDLDTVEIVE